MADTKTQDKGTEAVQWAEDAQHDGLGPKDAVVDAATKGQAVTGYETLTLWETVMTFKVATAYCFAAAFSAATYGYQIG